MKRIASLLGGVLLCMFLMGPQPAARADEFEQTEAHPLRIVAYAVHPLGFAAEWLIARPLHWFVSLPYVDKVFGHRPHSDEGTGYYH